MTAADGTTSSAVSTRALAPARARIRNVASSQGLLIVLVLLAAGFTIALPGTFPTAANFRNIVNSQAVILVLALAVTLPLRAGDFDLSISAVMAMAASLVAVLAAKHHASVSVAVTVALGAGLLIGLVNALLVVVIKLDAFIATLGTMTAIFGLTSLLTSGEVIAGIPGSLSRFANAPVLGVPAAVWYGWALAAIAWYVYEKTPAGRYLLFTGGNREAARLAGIRVDLTRAGAFVGAALVSAFAGILLSGALGAVDPNVGGAYLLPPYAAAFLGSTTIQVGRFNAVGTVVGLYLLAVGVSGLQLLGAAGWVSDVFNGVALVVAVAFAKLVRTARSR